MSFGRLLCLGCREEGHAFNDCTNSNRQSVANWIFSRKRLAMSFESAWNSTKHQICERCRDLDLLKILNDSPPWTTQRELTRAFDDGHQLMKSLGHISSLLLWSDCSVCRCLFAMTPAPQNGTQEVFLFPDWTLQRLAGEDGVEIDNDMKRQSATCLVIALKPSGFDLSVSITAHRGDALCLLDNDLKQGQTLGGRRIDQGEVVEELESFTSVSQRLEVIQKWINTCAANHSGACSPVRTGELNEARLFDVHSRKIISYPGSGAEYVALSYVWGDVRQPSFNLGDDLESIELPKTIEDAIWFTKQLGKQYLWVDSICIEQENEAQKLHQIDRMWSIYRGSVVTLLALSSDSAEGGIPRLSRKDKFSQMTCRIDGKRLVGVMPTLSNQIWVCPWGQRAWTLQEAILSPRCLYFSDHQIHFECKAMQCCESLQETRSPSHQLSVNSAPVDQSFVLWMAKQLGPGCLRIDSHSGRLDQYGRKLTLYSSRDMTDPNDGLNAFKGVLQKMEEIYPGGFYEGLPVEDFDWGLLWRHRYSGKRRKEFPSWSWAGWKAGLWHGQPLDVTQPRRFPIHLSIHKAEGERLIQVFKTDPTQPSEGEDLRISITNDAIDRAWRKKSTEQACDLTAHPYAELNRHLFIDGVVLHFPLDFSQPVRWVRSPSQDAYFQIYIRNVRCLLSIMSLDREIAYQPAHEARTFVLIARDSLERFIIHHLMMIQAQPGASVYERITVVQLFIPLDRLDVLEELSLQRKQIVLA